MQLIQLELTTQQRDNSSRRPDNQTSPRTMTFYTSTNHAQNGIKVNRSRTASTLKGA